MILAKALCLKIRKQILEGDTYVQIRKDLDIAEGTWDSWYWEDKQIPDIKQGFRQFVKFAKYERMMEAVNTNLEDFLYLDDLKEDGKKDPALAKLRQDTTKFVAERLGKIDFSTKVEQDITSNGKELPTPILGYVHTNDSIEKDIETK